VSPPRRRKTPARAKSSRSNPSRSKTGRRPPPVRDFWGRVDDATPPPDAIRPVHDPTVLVRSLGPPPLPAHETVAEHYFDAVYDKAANLAVALAAASGLLATEDADETAGDRP
jgi:hypothetical protein